jgi:hypothetical protein
MRQRSHFRNRRCLAKCRRRLGRAFALKPAEEASSSRSQSAAAVPDIDASSRTVRPPFRLFDPFSAGLLRFQPNGSSTAPVRTPVATEFNPGERHYDTKNLRPPSIRNSQKVKAASPPSTTSRQIDGRGLRSRSSRPHGAGFSPSPVKSQRTG